MTEKATELAKANPNALAQYGKTTEIELMAERIIWLMPGSVNYTKPEAFMMAQLCIAHDLDPFNGEAWLIKDNSGRVLGMLIGIKGLRKHAKRQANYWGVGANGGFRHIINEDELKEYNATLADTVYVYEITDEPTQDKWIEGLTSLRMAGFDQDDARTMMGDKPPSTLGIGVYKKGESTKMKPNQCAMFRAEKDALKRRFDVGFVIPAPSIEDTRIGDGVEYPTTDEILQELAANMEDKDGEANGEGEYVEATFEEVEDPEHGEEPETKEVARENALPIDNSGEPKMGFVHDEPTNTPKPDLNTVVADSDALETEPEKEPEPEKKGKLPPNPIIKDRPYSPKALLDAVEKWADVFPSPCSDKHRKYLNEVLLTMFDGNADDVEKFCEYITGQPGAFYMEDGYVQALLQSWMGIGDWKGVPSNISIIEGKSTVNFLPVTNAEIPVGDEQDGEPFN